MKAGRVALPEEMNLLPSPYLLPEGKSLIFKHFRKNVSSKNYARGNQIVPDSTCWLEARGARTAAVMPSQSQWLRARATHSFFKSSDNVDCSIHQLVFKFCDCPPQIFSGKNRHAFSLLTDSGSVVTWGVAGWGGDSRGVAEQLSSGVQTVVG